MPEFPVGTGGMQGPVDGVEDDPHGGSRTWNHVDPPSSAASFSQDKHQGNPDPA